jgi:ubiquitin-like-conjugating enzyme ATG10
VRYCQAALGPLRKQWRLNLHTALDTSATSYVDQVTFLQITRPFDTEAEDQLTSLLGNVALEESMASTRRSTRQATTDRILIDMEDADKVRSMRYGRSGNSFLFTISLTYLLH